MTLPWTRAEDHPCFASLPGVAGGWWWPWDTARLHLLVGQQVDVCWQCKDLNTWLSSSHFPPIKELHIPLSCSFIVLLQISSFWEVFLAAPLQVPKLLSLFVGDTMGAEGRSDIPDPKLDTNPSSRYSPGLRMGPRLCFNGLGVLVQGW